MSRKQVNVYLHASYWDKTHQIHDSGMFQLKIHTPDKNMIVATLCRGHLLIAYNAVPPSKSKMDDRVWIWVYLQILGRFDQLLLDKFLDKSTPTMRWWRGKMGGGMKKNAYRNSGHYVVASWQPKGDWRKCCHFCQNYDSHRKQFLTSDKWPPSKSQK